MKKYFYMAVAAIAVLSSCSNDNEFEPNQPGKQSLVFTATMENSEGTRAILDTDKDNKKFAAWDKGDQISINGKTYSAQAAGTTTTFEADGDDATGETYNAYFPASLYNGKKAALPAIQTYTAGKFNMPMYATSTTTSLQFYNLCAVLAITVTSADIATLKSIKVASDKVMNGSFLVSGNKAVMGTDGTNVVVLESSTALTLNADGTTFYIAIPAQEYAYLNIFLSADGTTYTQAMATKKATGLGTIARSKIFNIDYAKNATKLWDGNLFIADCNVGATSATDKGTEMTFTDAIKTGADYVWGANWRTPTRAEMLNLKDVECEYKPVNDVRCFIFTGKDGYTNNTVLLPSESNSEKGKVYCSTSTKNNKDGKYAYLEFDYGGDKANEVTISTRTATESSQYRVRPVLDEAESPTPATPETPATTGSAKATIGGSDVDMNWVQLWEDGPKFAEYNVGASSAAETGTTMSFTNATAENFTWGSNWCTPNKDQMDELLKAATSTGSEHVTCQYCEYTTGDGKWGFKFTGKKTGYTSNSVFFPALDADSNLGSYWSATVKSSNIAWYMNLRSDWSSSWNSASGVNKRPVRPVLVEK